ncbi:hypothetical protein V6N13_019880 [Hibiscus sabdariffa]
MKNPSHSPDENLRNKKPRQHDEEPPDDWPSDMEVNISVPAANLIVIDPTSPRNVEEGYFPASSKSSKQRASSNGRCSDAISPD